MSGYADKKWLFYIERVADFFEFAAKLMRR